MEACDFITDMGHRTPLGSRAEFLGFTGGGPQWMVTELGVFDYPCVGRARAGPGLPRHQPGRDPRRHGLRVLEVAGDLRPGRSAVISGRSWPWSASTDPLCVRASEFFGSRAGAGLPPRRWRPGLRMLNWTLGARRRPRAAPGGFGRCFRAGTQLSGPRCYGRTWLVSRARRSRSPQRATVGGQPAYAGSASRRPQRDRSRRRGYFPGCHHVPGIGPGACGGQRASGPWSCSAQDLRETGAEGREAASRRGVAAARVGGLRLVGPNCFGVQNAHLPRVNASIAVSASPPRRGGGRYPVRFVRDGGATRSAGMSQAWAPARSLAVGNKRRPHRRRAARLPAARSGHVGDLPGCWSR